MDPLLSTVQVTLTNYQLVHVIRMEECTVDYQINYTRFPVTACLSPVQFQFVADADVCQLSGRILVINLTL